MYKTYVFLKMLVAHLFVKQNKKNLKFLALGMILCLKASSSQINHVCLNKNF